MHLVLSMVDDVGQLISEKANVQGMSYGTNHRWFRQLIQKSSYGWQSTIPSVDDG